ncbi:MAG TPA: carboxypeptidase regulatory-like domain-containing protein [Bryobacteraceae bacterium]|nr:carboxypeptidase regulatory-like domain-containing protein [Bryobacteraceae bacterium]
MTKRTVLTITISTATLVAACIVTVFIVRSWQRHRVRDLTGVVLVEDADRKKQRPLAGVEVSVDGGVANAETDATGLFHLKLPLASLLNSVSRNASRNSVSISLSHAEYEPLYRTIEADGRLAVLRMKPVAQQVPAGPEIPVSDVRLRYTESAQTSTDTGPALKSFDVINTGNVPCNGDEPCSPDGKWKAAVGGASLDAGEGNEFREARVSCVAGPCPFTRIEHDGFSRGGRNISVSVRDWSDTVTFILEAEVSRTSLSDRIRLSYPLIFSGGMNFSMPASGEGPSLEATVGGFEAVYPIEPALATSWASCTVQVAKDMTRSYRCDLKPGYRFQ